MSKEVWKKVKKIIGTPNETAKQYSSPENDVTYVNLF